MNALFDLTGRNALVTGATQGLGFALAVGLGQAGATVIINARNQQKLDDALKKLKDRGINAQGALFDVVDSNSIQKGISFIEKNIGTLDILVNNASIQRRFPLEDFPEDDWDEVINTNLGSVFKVTKVVVKGMIERQSGKIINVCSLMSELGRFSTGAYTASKGGVKMLTKAMTTEWAKNNIQINGIGPGYFDTEMTHPLVVNEEFSNWLCKRTPANRWGNPEELVGTAVFLASKASDFVNGQIIYVDGGILAAL